jgi:hypothetical protein
MTKANAFAFKLMTIGDSYFGNILPAQRFLFSIDHIVYLAGGGHRALSHAAAQVCTTYASIAIAGYCDNPVTCQSVAWLQVAVPDAEDAIIFKLQYC